MSHKQVGKITGKQNVNQYLRITVQRESQERGSQSISGCPPQVWPKLNTLQRDFFLLTHRLFLNVIFVFFIFVHVALTLALIKVSRVFFIFSFLQVHILTNNLSVMALIFVVKTCCRSEWWSKPFLYYIRRSMIKWVSLGWNKADEIVGDKTEKEKKIDSRWNIRYCTLMK